MKVIAVAALKGGVGKTTTSLSLAYIAANEMNEKVLLIDSDGQSSSSIVLGVTPNDYDPRTPFDNILSVMNKLKDEDLSYEEDMLIDDVDDDTIEVDGLHTIYENMILDGKGCLTKEMIDQCIHRPKYTISEIKKDNDGKYKKGADGKVIREKISMDFGFDLIPSTEYLNDIQLYLSRNVIDSQQGIKNQVYSSNGTVLSTVLKFIEKNYNYDTVIIDCPPSLELLTANALFAAESGVVICASQDKQSLFSLLRIKKNLSLIVRKNRKHNGILGILQTIYKKGRTVDEYIAKTVGYDTKLHVFNTKISETTDAKKALLPGLILPQINARNFNETISLYKEINKRIEYLDEAKTTRNKIFDEMENR